MCQNNLREGVFDAYAVDPNTDFFVIDWFDPNTDFFVINWVDPSNPNSDRAVGSLADDQSAALLLPAVQRAISLGDNGFELMA